MIITFFNYPLQLKDVSDDSLMQQTSSEVVLNSGYTKPLLSAKLCDIAEISQSVALHYTLLQSLAEMNQLKKGLESFGLLEIIKRNSNLLAHFFTCQGSKKLTAGIYIQLFL